MYLLIRDFLHDTLWAAIYKTSIKGFLKIILMENIVWYLDPDFHHTVDVCCKLKTLSIKKIAK